MSDSVPVEPTGSVPSDRRRASADQLEELRELLFGAERKALCDILLRFSDTKLQIEELSRVLPSAISQCRWEGDQLANVLLPVVQEAIKQSAERNPGFLVDVLVPVLRPAINKWLVRCVALLLLVNLGLLVALGYLLSRSGHQPPPASLSSPRITNSLRPTALVATGAAMGVQTNGFDWRQLESEDYRTYIARLRAIGCPDRTIRDLIIADVDSLLAPRLRTAAPRQKELKYWQTDEKELWDMERRALIRRQRQDIDFEKRDIVWQLMGIDLVAERLKLQGEEDSLALRLSSLSDENRKQIRKLLDTYGEQELSIREKETRSGTALTENDQAELRRLFRERDQQIAKVLSPAEFEQYQLWYSPAAYKVRQALFGMEPNEQEFRAVYELTKTFDDTWEQEPLDPSDAAARQGWAQAKAELDSQIKSLLGETRYAEYQRNQDPDFRALTLAVARYNLPQNTAQQVYEAKSVIQAERMELLASDQFTPEQKTTLLKEVANETERTVRGLLGEPALSYYRRQGQGTWISK
jgi:hypothetical protein